MRKFPSYPSKPHTSGQARIKIGGRDVYLGVHGSPESWKEYERLLSLWNTSPMAAVEITGKNDATVAEIVEAWRQAHPDGEENERILRAARVLVRLYGSSPAAKFDANALETVRVAMVKGTWLNDEERDWREKHKKPLGWCANQANDCTSRIKRIWRWAGRKNLVPPHAYAQLLTLPPIGRSEDVRRTPRRRAADEVSVQGILPYLTPMVAAMVQLQTLTGMRPSELVKMRVSQIDVSGEHWLYTMDQHKTLHLDQQDSIVVMGPESQLILYPYIEAAKRAGRDAIWTPRPQSSERYTATGYYRAIHRACAKAGVRHFSPYQLRHLAKKVITREHGLDAARAALRQRTLATTDGYDRGVDLETAKRVAR